MNALRLYAIQRITAAVLAPLVVGHLLLIVYATWRGLSAEAILARTQGSVAWAVFYIVFVLAAAAHGAIGVRAVAREWGPRRLARSERALDALMWMVGLGLAALGLRAVVAVVA